MGCTGRAGPKVQFLTGKLGFSGEMWWSIPKGRKTLDYRGPNPPRWPRVTAGAPGCSTACACVKLVTMAASRRQAAPHSVRRGSAPMAAHAANRSWGPRKANCRSVTGQAIQQLVGLTPRGGVFAFASLLDFLQAKPQFSFGAVSRLRKVGGLASEPAE